MKLFVLIVSCSLYSILLPAQLTWHPIPSIYGDYDIESIAVSPAGKWYIKGHNILYSSEDAGDTWDIETTFGFNTNIRNLKFLQDDTPVFGTQNPSDLLIKREGEWINLPASNDCEVLLDTLYAIRSGRVQKTFDKGVTWVDHLRKAGSTIFRYRQHHGRHYIEYSEGVNRKFGETTLDGTILRWEWSQLSNFQMFVIDDCDNAHFVYDDYHTVLYADGSDESKNFNYIKGKFTFYKDRLYRLANDYLYENIPCSHQWELVGEFDGGLDIFAFSTDTLMFAFEKHISTFALPQEELVKKPIQNCNYISWMQEEISGGTKFLRVNAGSYRIRPDGIQESMPEELQHLKFSQDGWIYQEYPSLPSKLVLSKDAGMTWDTISKPSAIPSNYYLFPVNPEIIVYATFDTIYLTLQDTQVFALATDPSTNQSIYQFQYQILGDLLLMKGYDYIAGFDLITHEYFPLLFVSDDVSTWSLLDEDGTLFMLDEEQKVLTSVPYPYQNKISVTLPQGYFRNATNVKKGYVVAHSQGLYHFTKDLFMTKIDMGPLADEQLASMVYAQSGNWIVNTFSRIHGAYVSSGQVHGSDMATLTGQVFKSDQTCAIETPIASANWKFHFTNPENDFLFIGNSGTYFSINLPPGDYDVDVIPPPFALYSPCEWPDVISIPDSDAITEWNVTSEVTLCDAATVSISSVVFRRCFESMGYVTIRNIGGLDIAHPEIIITMNGHQVIVASPYEFTQSGNEFRFTPGELVAGSSLVIPFTLLTECSVGLAEELCIHARLNVGNSCAAMNYTDELCMDAVGSWDPNDKQATDERGAQISEFELGEYITYKIRFQNTGNDTAFNIRIRDILDPNLDLLTFEMISSSHPCTYKFEGGRELFIDYWNILLPDSTKNLLASNGFFEFRIKANENITPTDTLFNSADIFFDFNEAVVTNRVPVIMKVKTGSSSPTQHALFISPNPARDFITVAYEKSYKTVQVQIMNLNGCIIERNEFKDNLIIPVQHLAPGQYLLRIYSEDTVDVLKFIKL